MNPLEITNRTGSFHRHARDEEKQADAASGVGGCFSYTRRDDTTSGTFGAKRVLFFVYTYTYRCRLTLKRQPGCDDTRGCFGWRAGAARARLLLRLLVTNAGSREIDRMTPAHACLVSLWVRRPRSGPVGASGKDEEEAERREAPPSARKMKKNGTRRLSPEVMGISFPVCCLCPSFFFSICLSSSSSFFFQGCLCFSSSNYPYSAITTLAQPYPRLFARRWNTLTTCFFFGRGTALTTKAKEV